MVAKQTLIEYAKIQCNRIMVQFLIGVPITSHARMTDRNCNADRQLAKPVTSFPAPDIGTRLPRRARHAWKRIR